MPTLGSYSDWSYWRGVLQPPAKTVATFNRPAVRGVGAVVGAEVPQVIQVEFGKTYTAAELATAQTRQANVRALAGTVVTATDVFGNSYNSTLVLDATATIQAIHTGYLLVCTAQLMPETSP